MILDILDQQITVSEAIEQAARDTICAALDFPSGDKAIDFLKKVRGKIYRVKVGKELFEQEGPSIYSRILEIDEAIKIFRDGKDLDIPNTLDGVARSHTRNKVGMFNLMCVGGSAMMKAAVDGATEEAAALGLPKRPDIIGVTVLTSIDQKIFTDELKMPETLSDYVAHLALMGKNAGIDGVVCSAWESGDIKRICGPNFLTVNPGIRRPGADVGDQKRVASPYSAKIMGADVEVIGRDLTADKDPAEAADIITQMIAEAILRVPLMIYLDGGVQISEKGFRLKSHDRWPDAPLSPIFMNIRARGSSTEHEGPLSDETITAIAEYLVTYAGKMLDRFDYIVGLPSAGEILVDKMMASLGADAKIQRLYLDKAGKGSGRKLVAREGADYPKKGHVLVVDDLITKADTKLEAVEILRSLGLTVETLVYLDREQGGPEELAEQRVPLYAAITMSKLLDILFKQGLVDQAMLDRIRNYQTEFDKYTSTNAPVA